MANESTESSSDKQKAGQARTTQQRPGTPAGGGQIALIGVGLLALALLLAYLFLVFWPAGLNPTAGGDAPQENLHLFGQALPSITLDVRLLLMVMAAGGLGSFVHVATSFGDYVGNEKLTTNWVWWYVLRPFIGMILAAVFYLVVRGGFLSAGTEAGRLNPYGVAALAALVGMFSKQATDKLDELFNTLFRTAATGGDSKRKDDLLNPVPNVTDVEPKLIEPKTENVVVTIVGTGFVNGAVIRINGVNRETMFNDVTRLTAKLLPEDVAEQREVEVSVFNPGPGGGISTPIKLKIAPKPGPSGDAGAAAPGSDGQAVSPAALAPAVTSSAPQPLTTPEPVPAAEPDPEDSESDVDGCDVPIEDATPDEELPSTKGGVA
jgi:hypothetical protein